MLINVSCSDSQSLILSCLVVSRKTTAASLRLERSISADSFRCVLSASAVLIPEDFVVICNTHLPW